MKLLPWILLILFIAFTAWKWPRPDNSIREEINAAKAAKDSIMKLYYLKDDSLMIARGEKIMIQEMLEIQYNDLQELKSKYEKLCISINALDASGSIGFLHSWADTVPSR